MDGVFVTGGSGFVGDALVRRLVGDGRRVRALARSDTTAAALAAVGAEPVLGDLGDEEVLAAGAAGCEVVFNCAARVGEWGPLAEFRQVNVDGTRNVLRACERAGVGRLVHVSSESVLLHGKPLAGADETWPLRPRSRAHYAATKAQAELVLREARDVECVSVRPVLVWGPGDRTIRPGFAAGVRAGRFVWVDHGRHLTSTTHIDNAVHGLLLAAEHGRAGEAYSISDGEPISFRAFITALLATIGVTPPERSLPGPVARALAAGGETAWRVLRLNGRPPLTRTVCWLAGLERTISIEKARRELGYEPVLSRAEGLAALQ